MQKAGSGPSFLADAGGVVMQLCCFLVCPVKQAFGIHGRSSAVRTEGIGAFPKCVTQRTVHLLTLQFPFWTQMDLRLGVKLVFPNGLYSEALASVGIAVFSFKDQ